MADLGLLLQDDLALAAFEGRKTVSRRPIGPQPQPATAHPKCRATWSELRTTKGSMWRFFWHTPRVDGSEDVDWGEIHAPVIRGAGTAEVGGRVWVRECWGTGTRPCPQRGWWDGVEYRADLIDHHHEHLPLYEVNSPDDVCLDELGGRWRPSIHMPKWACRTWGRITSVTPCDLSTVDDAEAALEGFETADQLKATLKALYPDAIWYWRIEWERIETQEVSCG